MVFHHYSETFLNLKHYWIHKWKFPNLILYQQEIQIYFNKKKQIILRSSILVKILIIWIDYDYKNNAIIIVYLFGNQRQIYQSLENSLQLSVNNDINERNIYSSILLINRCKGILPFYFNVSFSWIRNFTFLWDVIRILISLSGNQL